MTRTRSARMLLTAAFLAIAGTMFGQAADEKIVLRLRLKEGESYRQRMTTEQKIAQTIGQQQIDMDQKMGMEFQFDVLAVGPDGPVGLEDSWSEKIVISKGFGMIEENTWTLKARRDGKALVSVTSKVSPNPQAAAIAVGTMKIGYDLSGKQEGTIEIDEATGWTLRQELTQELSGKVRLEGGPSGLKESSWPISIRSKILVETPGK